MTERFAVYLTDSAKIDLREIYDGLATRRSHTDAANLIEALLDKVDTLRQFPRRGKMPHEGSDLGEDEIRQIAFDRYRMIYRISASSVYVLMIADARSNLQRLLQRRLSRRD